MLVKPLLSDIALMAYLLLNGAISSLRGLANTPIVELPAGTTLVPLPLLLLAQFGGSGDGSSSSVCSSAS
jgi:hypothetical protein